MDIGQYKAENPESWLNALEAAGVDNWCGYDMAHDLLREEMKENGIEETE